MQNKADQLSEDQIDCAQVKRYNYHKNDHHAGGSHGVLLVGPGNLFEFGADFPGKLFYLADLKFWGLGDLFFSCFFHFFASRL